MEKTMKQEIEDLKKEITRLQTIITELETKTTYPTETELYTNDLYNPNSYKTYPTHAVNYKDHAKVQPFGFLGDSLLDKKYEIYLRTKDLSEDFE